MQNFLVTLGPFILMFALFYLIIFIPENRRKKKYAAMLNSLKVNDEVMTRGGIIGKIVNLQDNFVIVQTGPDKMRIKFDKSGVTTVLTQSTENKVEDKQDK